MSAAPPAAPSPSGPVRLAVFIDSLTPGGGTENQFLLLLSAFDRERVQPFLLTLRQESPALHELPAPGVNLAISRLFSPRGLLGLWRATRTLRRERSELALTLFRDSNLVGTLAARLAGVPVISSRRNLGRGYWHSPAQLWLLRRLNALTAQFLANSQAVCAYTAESERVPRARITVIGNAIDTTRFRPPTEEERLAARRRWGLESGERAIACVANLRPVKDHRTLLAAFAQAHRQQENLRLLLAGSGPEKEALSQYATELGLDRHVRFLGSVADASAVLHACEAAVLSSVAESSPNAVIEALACGLPVAATAVGGVPELLADRPFGRLAPAAAPEALAAALLELLAGPSLDPAVRGAARAFVEERFSLPAVLDRWYAFLTNCRA